MKWMTLVVVLIGVGVAACGGKPPEPPTAPSGPSAPEEPGGGW